MGVNVEFSCNKRKLLRERPTRLFLYENWSSCLRRYYFFTARWSGKLLFSIKRERKCSFKRVFFYLEFVVQVRYKFIDLLCMDVFREEDGCETCADSSAGGRCVETSTYFYRKCIRRRFYLLCIKCIYVIQDMDTSIVLHTIAMGISNRKSASSKASHHIFIHFKNMYF